jgi:hypothetical protein
MNTFTTTSLANFGLLAALVTTVACGTSAAATTPAGTEPNAAADAAEPAPSSPTNAPESLREGPYQKLGKLVGDWAGTGSLQMGETAAPVTSDFSCEVAPGGVALACTHRAQIEGMGPLVENALIGIDPASGKLHWYNINTMGETHDHIGAWASDETIEWRLEGEAEGQPLVESITMDVADATLSFRSETTVGGQRASLFEGSMQRSKGSPS